MKENLIPECINPPSRSEQMKTVIYGSELDNEGTVNILVSGMNGIREIGEQCIAIVNWNSTSMI